MPQANEIIGPYRLLEELGSGQFGIVWKAERHEADAATHCAIKFPLSDEIDLEKLRGEARVWAQASGHPNVLPLVEARLYGNRLLIVSEYVEPEYVKRDGKKDSTLLGWLSENGGRAPSVESAAEMMDGVLRGLAFLHSRQTPIIHRDLKPANIMLQGGLPRLADFGLSRVLTSTNSTTVAGTLAYMAPEAFAGQRPGQIDVWAAGVILYQMLSGRLPFPQRDMASLIHAILNLPPDPLPAETPAPLREVVRRALAKNLAQRFQSAEKMRQELREAHRQILRGEDKPSDVHSPLETLRDSQPAPPGQVRFRVDLPEQPPRAAQRPDLQSFVEDLGGGVKLEMIALPGGAFQMGSDDYDSEKPIHRVTISPFAIGKYQVTQAQWQAVIGNNPSNFKGDDLPVENVSWKDAVAFCQNLSSQTGKTYRLPTEAEWEYACRAGTTTPFAFGSSLSSTQANFDGNYPYGGAAKGVYRQKTTPVGSFSPNNFGLHDMHGNVWEWCEDVWDDNYNGAPSDGSAWLSGGDQNRRVLRGGSWLNLGYFCRSANRDWNSPAYRDFTIGFRVVVVARTP